MKPLIFINKSQLEHIHNYCEAIVNSWKTKWGLDASLKSSIAMTNSDLGNLNGLSLRWDQKCFLVSSCKTYEEFFFALIDGKSTSHNDHPVVVCCVTQILKDLLTTLFKKEITLDPCESKIIESFIGGDSVTLMLKKDGFAIHISFSSELTQVLLKDYSCPLAPITLTRRDAILSHTWVTMKAHLHPIILPVSSIEQLAVGDVIQLKHRADEPVSLNLNNRETEVQRGRLDQHNDYKVIRII